MYELTLNEAALDWTPLDFLGVSIKTLKLDADTGAMTIMTRMAPGAVIPKHHHTEAAETVLVLDGDFVEDGIAYPQGTFFADPKGASHGPHTTRNGCTLLTTFSAKLDFVLDE